MGVSVSIFFVNSERFIILASRTVVARYGAMVFSKSSRSIPQIAFPLLNDFFASKCFNVVEEKRIVVEKICLVTTGELRESGTDIEYSKGFQELHGRIVVKL